MTAFQRLCLLACAVIFGLIVLGGVVRATDSGLGCPDWPRCHGSLIPKWEKHTLIEYSHRLTASVAGVLVLAVLVWAWRSYRRVPAILYPAALAFVLIIFQAWLGRETVVRELPEEIVTLHLAIALTTFSVLVTLTAATFALEHPAPRPAVGPGFGRLAVLAVATAFLLALLGAYVAGAALALFLVQSLVGAANVWTRLAAEASAAHLALATLLWLVLAYLNIRVHRLHLLLPLSSHEAPARLARAPH